MNTNDPSTWLELSAHPTFNGGEFDESWYDGDLKSDLKMLRAVAREVITQLPRYSVELHVLDDCTIFVTVTQDNEAICNIYPAQTDDYQSCYFIEFAGDVRELRLNTVSEVLDLLHTNQPNSADD